MALAKKLKDVQIVKWIDKNPMEERQIYSINSIVELEYDYVIVASYMYSIVKSMQNFLEESGVPKEKIETADLEMIEKFCIDEVFEE